MAPLRNSNPLSHCRLLNRTYAFSDCVRFLCVEATTEIGYSCVKLFMIRFASPSFKNVSLAVSSEQKKISTYGRISSIHAFASGPVQRFPRKFTSNEISVPFSLNRLIISMAVRRIFSLNASVIPLVWKHLVLWNISFGSSSRLILSKEVCLLSYTTPGFSDKHHSHSSKSRDGHP